jgi:tetratricopeptide (TPR) repeat protein
LESRIDMRISGSRALYTIPAFLVLVWGFALQNEGPVPKWEDLYWEADFGSVLEHLDKRERKDLGAEDALLLAECLARSGRGSEAAKAMGELIDITPRDLPPRLKSRTSATAGIVLFSLGRGDEARRRIRSALEQEPVSERALLAAVFLALEDRSAAEAVRWYEELARLRPERADSYLLYLVGLEVKKAEVYADGLRANARLSRRILGKGFFSVSSSSPESVIPFAPDLENRRTNVVIYEKKGARFKVLLDSGNRAGWTVHNPELLELLNSRRGGRIFSGIGTHPVFLEGYSVFTPRLELGETTIIGLAALYVPKPHPDFYDANLNPVFTGNRVVSLDYDRRILVFRTKDEFEKDLDASSPARLKRFPWLGFGHPFVRVDVEDSPALALIETGAEDISLRLDYARRLGLPLTERQRYLATGEMTTYHLTPVRLDLGPFRFDRDAAEVWPFAGLAQPITGLIPDVIIGPRALDGGYVLSFDSFDNQIVLEERPKNASRPPIRPGSTAIRKTISQHHRGQTILSQARVDISWPAAFRGVTGHIQEFALFLALGT